MNPLSAWTYYRRHKRHTAMLLSLSIVVTIGLYSMVALVWGAMVEPGRLAYMAYTGYSTVTLPSSAGDQDTAVLARLQSNRDIARIIPSTFIRIMLPGMVPGQGFQFDLMGLAEEDAAYLLSRLSATVHEGRMPQPGAAEIVLSGDVARVLGVGVGYDYLAASAEFYPGMDGPPKPTSLEVVGILDSDVELGIVSLEFLDLLEEYRPFPARFLIVPQEGRKAAVDTFLRSEIVSLKTGVMTQQMLSERIRNESLPGLLMLLPVVLVVAVALSLVIVVINQLANARRLPEIGILHATGRSRRWLIRRLTLETTVVALAGWAIGIGLSYLVLHLLNVTIFAAHGQDLNYVAWLPIVFSLPVPVAVAGFTLLGVRRTLRKLDPVAIVERRELGQEGELRKVRRASVSSAKPLAPTTFYRRHGRRSVLLVLGMSLMMVAVVVFVFALAVDADAQEAFSGYLRRVSLVRSPGIVGSLDPGIIARVKAHPAVERVIPVAPRYSMLNVHIPPFASAEASPFAVNAEDMAYLVALYGLELREGHLPRPGSNGMVIPEVVARNRGLELGDVIGEPRRPAYPGASALAAQFAITGIFASPAAAEDGSGMGFVSLEFLERQTDYDVPDSPPLIVVPRAGQKGVLDDWLENELAGAEASVLTYRREIARIRDKAGQDMFSMALLEGVLAVVAAIGVAVLNYVYISQRQSEFGVLHAIGYSRRWLVRRVLRETTFTAGIAWALTAVAGLACMLLLRIAVFAPLGLTFDLVNVTPWFYTLPIPVVVLAVTTGTTARKLRKLDAVSIVERR